MKMIALGFLSIHSFFCFDQSSNTSNAWLLAQLKVDYKRQTHVLELGHRRYENFLNHHRQSLFRYTFSYQANSKRTGFGGGIAGFIHERNEGRRIETEIRPFLQVSQLFLKKAIQFQLRFRNEFRFFDRSTKDQDRLRFQMLFSYPLHSDCKTRLLCFNEWFYICGSMKPWEWRGGVSIQQPLLRHWKLGIGYIYQNNENSAIRNIHVIQLSGSYNLLLN
ncbi:DUF2490 domain-containing protein [uncultured Fluviicola sp.]|uniref:DUF2490 domain-containing protein n=1 Tax=uncultured Fluviicola sp. TaxID=463303 RepID=UPI0025CE619D|nr:DUF2490 domain-containing protein [uncultured Fluviicola sp.]